MSSTELLAKKQNLSNAEMMKNISQVTFKEFCHDSDAYFSDRNGWNEWHLSYFKWDCFHYFSRTLPPNDKSLFLEKAFEHLQIIAEHQGRMNIHGVFIDREEVEVFAFKNRVYATIRLAYSEILNRWYFGLSYSYGNGGGGTPCSFCCNPVVNDIYSGKSREEVLLKGAENFHKSFSNNSSLDESERRRCVSAIENFMTDILGKTTLPIPTILQAKAVAVQGSLF